MSLRPLLAAALCCFGLVAQTTPPHFTVRGRVVNALTGDPVRGALVTLNGPEQHTGFANNDGQFQLEGVPAGNAILAARHPGYSDVSRPQPVNISDNVDNLIVKINPMAKITGQVRDSDGEPVEGVQILTMQRIIMNGRANWQQMGGTTTDEGGHFLIDNLQPGTFLLGTSQKPIYPGLPATDEASRLMFAPQFYPNSPDLASAQPIEIKPGDESRVDMTVSEVRGVRVSVSVTPPVQFIWGTLKGEGGRTINTPFQRDAKTGKFSLPSVPPGSWTLTANSQGTGPSAMGGASTGETQITVGNSDIDNVQVSLSPPISIPVNITGAAAPPPAPTPQTNARGFVPTSPPANNAFVRLVTASSSPPTMMFSMRNLDGGNAIQNVPPGTYRAVVQAFAPNCLDTITSGSLDLARNDLVVSADGAAQPINVTLQSNCAELDVTLNQKRDGTVILIGDSHATDPMIGNGSAKFTASPGDYTVYAFSDSTGLEYANPEAMRSFSGQHVTLVAGQKASVTLDVIDRN